VIYTQGRIKVYWALGLNHGAGGIPKGFGSTENAGTEMQDQTLLTKMRGLEYARSEKMKDHIESYLPRRSCQAQWL